MGGYVYENAIRNEISISEATQQVAAFSKGLQLINTK